MNRYAEKHLLKPIGKLEDLPPTVREKLHAHLVNKLGRRFLKRLKYDEGEYF